MLSTILVTLIMLNMLIAIMSDTFQRVSASRNQYRLKMKITFVSELSGNLTEKLCCYKKKPKDKQEVFWYVIKQDYSVEDEEEN